MTTEPLTKEEIKARLREAMKANPRPKPQPPTQTQAPEKPKVVRLVEQERRTKDVINAATAHNNDLTERLEETMEQRRQKRIAYELAQHAAEDPNWHRLVQWQQSVERAQERIRALDGEIPERGVYDPMRRFEREQRGR